MTVFARSSESALSEVETRGSLNQPKVLNAGDGLRYTSKPSWSSVRAADRAAPKSKNPLYGTRPTIGNHQLYDFSRSRYAAERTNTNVSCSSLLNVVKLSRARS